MSTRARLPTHMLASSDVLRKEVGRQGTELTTDCLVMDRAMWNEVETTLNLNTEQALPSTYLGTLLSSSSPDTPLLVTRRVSPDKEAQSRSARGNDRVGHSRDCAPGGSSSFACSHCSPAESRYAGG